MTVLLLTTLYPTIQQPDVATFIVSRLRAHRELGTPVRGVALALRYSVPARVMMALAGRPTPDFLARESLQPVYYERTLRALAVERRAVSERTTRALADRVHALSAPTPDVVHAHGMYALPAGEVGRWLAERWGIPLVVTLHGSDVHTLLATRPDRYRKTLDSAAATVFVSDALRRRAEEVLGTLSNASVIPNGVDPSTFHPSVRPSPERPLVLYVGRLERVKGADRLPEIWHRTRPHLPQAELHIVGTGTLDGQLRHALRDGAVVHHGNQPHSRVAELMASASVLVVPSREEGWPTVVLEAYACGTPVVAAIAGGMPEVVLDPELLVPQGASFAADFAQAVVAAVRQPPRSDVLLARAAGYDWRAVATDERRLYQGLGGFGTEPGP